MRIRYHGENTFVDELHIGDFFDAKLRTGKPIIRFKYGANWDKDSPELFALQVKVSVNGTLFPLMGFGYPGPKDSFRIEHSKIIITPFSKPEYRVVVDIPCDEWVFNVTKVETDLMDLYIKYVLFIVFNTIINRDYEKTKYDIVRHDGNATYSPIVKAIFKGLFENPELQQQSEEFIYSCSYDKHFNQQTSILIMLAECAYESKNMELFKQFSTETRTQLITHFLKQDKTEIVAQLTHYATPIDPKDIADDEKWKL